MEMEGCIVMKKFLGEFKEFALRGNVMDLAIGIIIGAAFQAIVTSLTGDIISPLLGLFGQVNFDSLAITVGQATIRYGAFLTAVLNFVIMALVIFLFVKLTNKLSKWGKKPVEEQKAATKICPYCCSEISLEAKRCPHCTSVLDNNQSDSI